MEGKHIKIKTPVVNNCQILYNVISSLEEDLKKSKTFVKNLTSENLHLKNSLDLYIAEDFKGLNTDSTDTVELKTGSRQRNGEIKMVSAKTSEESLSGGGGGDETCSSASASASTGTSSSIISKTKEKLRLCAQKDKVTKTTNVSNKKYKDLVVKVIGMDETLYAGRIDGKLLQTHTRMVISPKGPKITLMKPSHNQQ